MTTLWDLLLPAKRRVVAPAARKPVAPRPAAPKPAMASSVPAASSTPGRLTMAEKYERMSRAMLSRYGVRVRKWRSSMSGVAWQVTYADGTVSRLIESPRPKGPVSASIFLHEIGHHAIGLGAYKPRCLEEYHAWMFSLAQMEAWDLNVSEQVHKRVRESLEYAVWKARRRGLKRLPVELAAFAGGESEYAEGAEESRRSRSGDG